MVSSDLYHGEIWKKFAVNSKWFFEQPINFAVMKIVNWFQPYRHPASYSVGAIYLIIKNLGWN